MRAFNPFEGGPARKAPAVSGSRFNCRVLKHMDERSDPIPKGSAIADQIVAFMRLHPERDGFSHHDLSRWIGHMKEPARYLSLIARNGLIDYHKSSSKNGPKLFVLPGQGTAYEDIHNRLRDCVIDALRANGGRARSQVIKAHVSGKLTDNQLRIALNRLHEQGRIKKQTVNGRSNIWSLA